MDYLVKIRSVQTPLNGQFSIGANMWISRVKRAECTKAILVTIMRY